MAVNLISIKVMVYVRHVAAGVHDSGFRRIGKIGICPGRVFLGVDGFIVFAKIYRVGIDQADAHVFHVGDLNDTTDVI